MAVDCSRSHVFSGPLTKALTFSFSRIAPIAGGALAVRASLPAREKPTRRRTFAALAALAAAPAPSACKSGSTMASAHSTGARSARSARFSTAFVFGSFVSATSRASRLAGSFSPNALTTSDASLLGARFAKAAHDAGDGATPFALLAFFQGSRSRAARLPGSGASSSRGPAGSANGSAGGRGATGAADPVALVPLGAEGVGAAGVTGGAPPPPAQPAIKRRASPRAEARWIGCE